MHDVHKRLRVKTGDGTTNLQKSASACDTVHSETSSAIALQNGNLSIYSPAAHRTVIAMKSATSNRPFNAVHNKYYKMEVEMLRPGTVIPHPTTVSLDIKHLYVELSKTVRSYFKVCSVIFVGFFFSPTNHPLVVSGSCCSFCHRWMDGTTRRIISWHCRHLVRKRQNSPSHSQVCKVSTLRLMFI